MFYQIELKGLPDLIEGIVTGSPDIDFINKTIGKGSSCLNIDATAGETRNISANVSIASQSYEGTPGPAAFLPPGDNGYLYAIATLLNSGDVIAQEATVSVSYDDGGHRLRMMAVVFASLLSAKRERRWPDGPD